MLYGKLQEIIVYTFQLEGKDVSTECNPLNKTTNQKVNDEKENLSNTWMHIEPTEPGHMYHP